MLTTGADRPSGSSYRAAGMGKAADWLREERRNVLGHWTAFCVDCGAARRWFEEFESDVPKTCSCGGRIIRRCPECEAPISSTFAARGAISVAMYLPARSSTSRHVDTVPATSAPGPSTAATTRDHGMTLSKTSRRSGLPVKKFEVLTG